MRATSMRSWVLVVTAAFLQVMPFPVAGPVPLWRRTFCWFCLAPLLAALIGEGKDKQRLRPKQAGLLAYACGILWYLGNCYWIYPTMHSFGHIYEPIALGILLLFCLYLGLYYFAFGWCVSVLNARFSKPIVLAVVPFLWVAVELARARITGFPWDLLGYAQVDNLVLTRMVPLTGVFGLSLLVAIVNALWMVRIPGNTKWTYAGPAAATILSICFVAAMFSGKPNLEVQANATAILLQENLNVGSSPANPEESKQHELASFSAISTASVTKRVDVVVWPEAPADFFDDDPEFRAALGSLALKMNAPVIADSVKISQRQPELQIFNSASFFAPDGQHVGRYDKMHLVPFGEYTPYKQLFFFAGHLLDDVGPFIPGTTREAFVSGGHRYGAFICYESIFGDEIRQFAKAGADVLVNISDDGWYGDSSAPWEHLDMARMRAIENDRWLLRATNTGVTGVIDPQGRVVAQMPRHIRGAIEVPFGYRNDVTFYTMHGDWLAWLCAVISAFAVGASLLTKRAVN